MIPNTKRSLFLELWVLGSLALGGSCCFSQESKSDEGLARYTIKSKSGLSAVTGVLLEKESGRIRVFDLTTYSIREIEADTVSSAAESLSQLRFRPQRRTAPHRIIQQGRLSRRNRFRRNLVRQSFAGGDDARAVLETPLQQRCAPTREIGGTSLNERWRSVIIGASWWKLSMWP